jgi:hypothetical protein
MAPKLGKLPNRPVPIQTWCVCDEQTAGAFKYKLRFLHEYGWLINSLTHPLETHMTIAAVGQEFWAQAEASCAQFLHTVPSLQSLLPGLTDTGIDNVKAYQRRAPDRAQIFYSGMPNTIIITIVKMLMRSALDQPASHTAP